MQSLDIMAEELIAQLGRIVGTEQVITGGERIGFATDIYRALEMPLAVVRPGSVDELAQVVGAATRGGAAICARGGGASYTAGYLPARGDSILLDLGALNRIVEINEQDAYVTVEAGVTWSALKDALDPLDYRTPFFGPFSGLVATVGGAMSQHAISMGTGAYGISAQSVLSLAVVLADGSLIHTGSAARGATPFMRHDGPDLTGLFLGDCGALGVKATITLALLRRKSAFGAASFAFESFPALHAAMRAAALEGLDDSHFALDSALTAGQVARHRSVRAMIGTALDLLHASPTLLTGLARLARLSVAGRLSLQRAAFTSHYIVEGADRMEVNARLKRLRALAGAHGIEIPNAVPTMVRSMPFAKMFNTLGPRGERWVPLHGVLPHSRAVEFHQALTGLYARHEADMRRLGVWTGAMFQAVGSTAFVYEITLYWSDAVTPYHRLAMPAAELARLPAYPQNPEAAAFVGRLRSELIALYARHGATHFQLGKTYPYAEALEPPALALVRSLKAALDPRGLMNPGALGL